MDNSIAIIKFFILSILFALLISGCSINLRPNPEAAFFDAGITNMSVVLAPDGTPTAKKTIVERNEFIKQVVNHLNKKGYDASYTPDYTDYSIFSGSYDLGAEFAGNPHIDAVLKVVVDPVMVTDNSEIVGMAYVFFWLYSKKEEMILKGSLDPNSTFIRERGAIRKHKKELIEDDGTFEVYKIEFLQNRDEYFNNLIDHLLENFPPKI